MFICKRPLSAVLAALAAAAAIVVSDELYQQRSDRMIETAENVGTVLPPVVPGDRSRFATRVDPAIGGPSARRLKSD